MSDPINDLLVMHRQIKMLPPRPMAYCASHSVPYGRVFRQWRTDGRMIAWVNRGEVADMERRRALDPFVAVLGTPIYNV